MPLAKGPFFQFPNYAAGYTDIQVDWGSANPNDVGHFFMDLNNAGVALDPTSFPVTKSGSNYSTYFTGIPVQQYRCRVENLDGTSNAVLEETVPASTPFASLPVVPMPPDPSTTTVTLTGATAMPTCPLSTLPNQKPFGWPHPFPIPPFALPFPVGVSMHGSVVTLHIHANSGAKGVANIPVTFKIVWGTGNVGPAINATTSVQVSTDASGVATAVYGPGRPGEIAVVTASTPYDAASLTHPTPFYVLVF